MTSESADPAADVYSGPFGFLRIHPEARVCQGEVRRRDGELNKPPHLFDFLLLDESRAGSKSAPAQWRYTAIETGEGGSNAR